MYLNSDNFCVVHRFFRRRRSDRPSKQISGHSAWSIRKGLGISSAPGTIFLNWSQCLHAIAVMTAPAVAPDSPKQAIVEKVGRASLVFAMTRGELPVAR